MKGPSLYSKDSGTDLLPPESVLISVRILRHHINRCLLKAQRAQELEPREGRWSSLWEDTEPASMVKTQSPKAVMLNAAAGHRRHPDASEQGRSMQGTATGLVLPLEAEFLTALFSTRSVKQLSLPAFTFGIWSFNHLFMGKAHRRSHSSRTQLAGSICSVTPLQATSHSLCSKPQRIPRKAQRKRIPVDCHQRCNTVSPTPPLVLSAQLGLT